MLRGIDSATSGMIALQRRMDALTNNLANLETPGYKQDASLLRTFPEMLLSQINNGKTNSTGHPNSIGTLAMGVYNQETLPLFFQGDLVSTNQPFDVAIEDVQLAPIDQNGENIKPSAFFMVQTADGEYRLTRNGRFSVNENGQLTTATGELVIGSNVAPIADPELSSGDVVIKENGEIILYPDDATRTRSVGTIGMVVVENPNQLIKDGNGFFNLDGLDAEMIEAELPEGVKLHHKMLEQSNVDLSQTIGDMMASIRLFEANQKVLQAYDKTLEQLNTVGRV